MWTKTANITATPTLGGPPTTEYKETLCFEPKALIIWETIGASATSPLEWRWSFCSSSSDEIAKRISVDFGSSTYTQGVSAGLVSGMSLVSFDADGFTLQFPDTSTRDLSYTAIGGDSLEAYVGTFVCTSGSSSDIAVTGVGFQPDFILVMQGDTGTSARGTLGMASGTSNQGVIGLSRGLLGSTGKYFNTDRISAFQGDTYLKTFDSDGFTLGFRASGAASVTTTYYFLALRDPTASFYVGNDSQKTSTGTKATTGVGFQPGAGWFMHSGNTSTGNNTSSPTAHVFSAADGTNENALGGYSYTSGTDYTYADSDLLPFVDSAGALLANAHLDSFDSDGFTLDWVNADAVARLFLYAVFETENPENDACAQLSAFVPQIYRRILN